MKMKNKGLFVVILLVGLAVAGIYLLIPSALEVSADQLVRCNASAGFRSLAQERAWAEFWPQEQAPGYSYRLKNSGYPVVNIELRSGVDSIPTTLDVLTIGVQDSTSLLWHGRIIAGATPWGRIAAYRRSLRISKRMREILKAAAAFMEKPENLYDMPVSQKMSKDSTIIVTQITTTGYPSTADIYRAIDGLRRYIAGESAREINHPMLHVTPGMDGSYASMVAIPVDRELKGTAVFRPMRFVPWKVLVGEIHGGPALAENGLRQLHLYVIDHQLTEMAMPFQLLVTERDKEPDTTRWITEVVTPVP